MSNYQKTVDFEAKDSLSSGDPGKLIKGKELDDEFDAIETASATKYDSTDLATAAQAKAQSSSGVLLTPSNIDDIWAPTSQTFSPSTYTGWSTDPDWTFNYIKVGNMVFVYEKGSASLQDTSDTTGASVTGWPAAIRPSSATTLSSIFPFRDNGNNYSAYATISTGGVVSFVIHNPTNDRLRDDAFTASGSKGLVDNTCFFYTIDA